MQIAPYISDRKKKRQRMRAYLFTGAGLVILYGIFFTAQWAIFHSPLFRVDHVVVQGNNAIASEDIIALAEASAMPREDFFRSALTFYNMMLWPDAIPQKELQLIPQLADFQRLFCAYRDDHRDRAATIRHLVLFISASCGCRHHEFERAMLLVRQHRHDLRESGGYPGQHRFCGL
jgi:hypothetical protein